MDGDEFHTIINEHIKASIAKMGGTATGQDFATGGWTMSGTKGMPFDGRFGTVGTHSMHLPSLIAYTHSFPGVVFDMAILLSGGVMDTTI